MDDLSKFVKYWDGALSALFPNDERREVLVELCGYVLYEPDFVKFFEAMCRGDSYQNSERHYIDMPAQLIKQEEYEGFVEICQDRFDGTDITIKIELRKYISYLKILGIYHSEHINSNFDPWPSFAKLDNLKARYAIL